jgi:hypothetical protein
MLLYPDTGLNKLTLRKPADTAQASIILGDNAQIFIYHDLTESFNRLAPAMFAYDNSRFCFRNIQNRFMSIICKLATAAASLLQSKLKTLLSVPLLTLTRSVVVICLSWYLQHLIWTV